MVQVSGIFWVGEILQLHPMVCGLELDRDGLLYPDGDGVNHMNQQPPRKSTTPLWAPVVVSCQARDRKKWGQT